MSNIEFSPYQLRSIFNLLLTDDDFCEEMFPALNEEHFNYNDPYLYLLAKAYWSLYRKYGVLPDSNMYVEEVFIQRGKTIELFLHEPSEEEVQNLQDLFLDILENPVKNKQYIVDNTFRILKLLAIHKSFTKNKKELTAGTINVDEFVQEIYDSINIVSPAAIGSNLFGDLDSRTSDRLSSPIILGKTSLGIAGLEDFFEDGGVSPGSLAFWLAPSGAGKTSALIYIAKEVALLDGLNVLFISAELPADVIKQRFDSCITGVPLWDVRKKADIVRKLYINSPQYTELSKKIHVVEVPMGSTTVKDIELIIEKLEKKGFKINLLVVDYADHLKSPKKMESNRFEIASVYKDLKALAVTRKLVVWTASQMNDQGVEESEKKKGVISMRHVAEARSKIHLCDACIAISRNQEDKDMNSARLTIIKNRLGSGEGQVFRIFPDYSTCRFYTGKGEPMKSVDPDAFIGVIKPETDDF